MKSVNFLFALLSCGLFLSCHKDKTIPPSDCGYTISYSADIVPIINSSCITGTGPGTGCHDAWILDYSNLGGKIKNGTWANRVFDIKDMPEMPNDFGIDSLTADEIQIMRCWIDQGWPNN